MGLYVSGLLPRAIKLGAEAVNKARCIDSRSCLGVKLGEGAALRAGEAAAPAGLRRLTGAPWLALSGS
jgi:hypothetical protein